MTQIVATRICRPADNKPCDGHPQTVPLGHNWWAGARQGIVHSVGARILHRGSARLQVAQSLPRRNRVGGFHDARAIVISFALPAVDFHEIRKCSTALHADPLCLFVPKSENKFGGCGYEFHLSVRLS